MPRVSVVLPTYNRSSTLPRAIRSVLTQSYRDFELILVDDGSTERIEDFVASTGSNKVRYIRRDERGGPGAARNLGIRSARGDLIAFQDSDDEWLDRKLEKQVASLDRESATVGLICAGYEFDRGRGPREYFGAARRPLGARTEATLLTNFGYIAPTWLVRREALFAAGLFNETLPSREDWELAIRLFRTCEFRVIDEPLVLKHRSPDGVDSNLRAHARSLERILRDHVEQFRRYPRIYAGHLRELGILQSLDGNVAGARGTLWAARSAARPGLRASLLWLATWGGPGCFRFALRLRHRLKSIYR